MGKSRVSKFLEPLSVLVDQFRLRTQPRPPVYRNAYRALVRHQLHIKGPHSCPLQFPISRNYYAP